MILKANLKRLLVPIVLFLLISAAVRADDILSRNASQTIDLSDFTGQTFLQMMLATNGLYATTQTDSTTAVTIAGPTAINDVVGNSDPKIAKVLYNEFKNHQTDFTSIVAKIEGKSLSSQDIFSTLKPLIVNLNSPGDMKFAPERCGDISLLASASGTLVHIDADHYFYNIAYLSSEPGRSYAVSSTDRKLLDQSDKGYLGELGNYLDTASATEASSLYTALFGILTQCDATGAGNLAASTQVITTDFIMIYTAELIRHNAVKLVVSKDPWEIDLGEVTLLTGYMARSGMVIQGGKLVAGAADVYGDGSIGTYESDFRALGKLITTYETTHHPKLVTAVSNLTPITDTKIAGDVEGDVFRRVFVYMSRAEFADAVHTNATTLSSAMVALLKQVRSDSAKITTYIQSQG